MKRPGAVPLVGVIYWVVAALLVVETASRCPYTLNLKPNPLYTGKVAAQGVKVTKTTPSYTECAAFCVFRGDKTSVVYDSGTSTCSCHNLPLGMLTLAPKPGAVAGGEVTQSDETVVLWIASILDESSHFSGLFGITNYPATEMIGPANYYPGYGNTEEAWCPGNLGLEYVELKISESIYIKEVHIYEVFWAGAVQTLSLLDQNSVWIPIWTSPALQTLEISRIFSPDFIPPSFKSDSLRIDLDLSITNEWAEFDAVRVIGTRSRSRNSL